MEICLWALLREHEVHTVDGPDAKIGNMKELIRWEIICWDGFPKFLCQLSTNVHSWIYVVIFFDNSSQVIVKR